MTKFRKGDLVQCAFRGSDVCNDCDQKGEPDSCYGEFEGMRFDGGAYEVKTADGCISDFDGVTLVESKVAEMPEIELTAKEKKAIAKLKAVAKDWPKTLWLFSASGTLFVMRTDENGQQATTSDIGGGYDSDYIVGRIPIPNAGGDW